MLFIDSANLADLIATSVVTIIEVIDVAYRIDNVWTQIIESLFVHVAMSAQLILNSYHRHD